MEIRDRTFLSNTHRVQPSLGEVVTPNPRPPYRILDYRPQIQYIYTRLQDPSSSSCQILKLLIVNPNPLIMKKLIFILIIAFPFYSYSQIINIPADYSSIQEGIDAANEGDTVLVHPGIYLEHLAILSKNITLASLFLTTADTTYISSTIIDGDTSGRVIYADGVTSETVIAGLTLRNGKTYDEPGAGLHIAGSSPTIAYMVISNNTAVMGGGIFCDGATLNVFNTILQENSGIEKGAGIMSLNSDVNLENCSFFDNHAPDGAGMNCLYSNTEGNFYSVDIQSCDYSDNHASIRTSGLFIGKFSGNAVVEAFLDDCTFSENTQNGNGALQIRGEGVGFNMQNCRLTGNASNTFTADMGFLGGCEGEVSNCLITNNIAAIGGGYWNTGGAALWGNVEVVFRNCTFAHNFASYGAGITVGPGSTAYISNSILWGNSNQQIALVDYDTSGGSLYIDYCDMQYGMDSVRVDPFSLLNWGDHNISGDPLFIASGEDPYGLSSASPCIDSGTPDTTGATLLPFDILGNIRVWDGNGSGTAIIDMGAYEFGAPVYVGIEDNTPLISLETIPINIFPNPCRDQVNIQLILEENQQFDLGLYSLNGKVLKEIRGKSGECCKYETQLNLDNIPAGIYLIRVQTDKLSACQKLIVY